MIRRSRRWYLSALFLGLFLSSALPVSAGITHYHAEFNPGGSPWLPPEEKNFEEVFTNYEYFAIEYSDDGRELKVSRYSRGSVAEVGYWQVQADGSLRGADGVTPAADLYARHCANCHGPDRLGVAGPALLPENLARLPRAEAANVIRDGRPTTQMPPFGA